jgi:hypothetical protein
MSNAFKTAVVAVAVLSGASLAQAANANDPWGDSLRNYGPVSQAQRGESETRRLPQETTTFEHRWMDRASRVY